ncbi:4975_t:CDS:2 [Ambispora gerdemannii]|uniref:4975_t:CDS:1 n=1 Tax=Ambispora gerdemannii TaxID=144530 RepID=A0A9N9AYD2_9GLOM|nr:4975_t:CDS:2 [Ambispora gerdemannii]
MNFLKLFIDSYWTSPTDQLLHIFKKSNKELKSDEEIVKIVEEWLKQKNYSASDCFAKVLDYYQYQHHPSNKNKYQYAALLAFLYRWGIGTRIDPQKTFYWYTVAAEKTRDPLAQNELGWCFSEGFGTKQDHKEALKWFMKSAESGNAIAAMNLGQCYFYGDGTSMDDSKALHWYEISARRNYLNGQIQLAQFYRYASKQYRSARLAKHWYEKAAKSGNPEAQVEIGYCYYHAIGVNKQLKDHAIEWYKKAAKQDYPRAQALLAKYYAHSRPSLSFEYYRKAANNGYPHAKKRLADCYAQGFGCPKVDRVRAFYWYRQCATNHKEDHGRAALRLAKCFDKGYGAQLDLHEAIKWFRVFQESGEMSLDDSKWCNQFWLKLQYGKVDQ